MTRNLDMIDEVHNLVKMKRLNARKLKFKFHLVYIILVKKNWTPDS